MPFQSAQPLEIDDFSGGITENYLQGDPRRSRYLDNWLIQVNKSIQVRPGIVPIDTTNYVFPASTGQRVNGLYFWMSEKILFGQTGRKIFVMNPDTSAWTEMSGFNSVDAISGGDSRSQTTYAEFQKQVFLAGDGQDGLGVMPSKIYQDSSNVWRAKTAGLPKAYVNGTYTSSSLLAACIYNANAIRTAMISHFNDCQFTTSSGLGSNKTAGTFLHLALDKYSLSYLVTQTFYSPPGTTSTYYNIPGYDVESPPSPVPTAASAATDQASLLALVGALNAAYTHHVTEASAGSLTPITGAVAKGIHQRALITGAGQIPVAYGGVGSAPSSGPYAVLAANATPTTVAQAATMLDDLLQKWNWHRRALWTHSLANDPDFVNRYNPQCTKIGTVTTGNSTPVVTPDFTDVISYANNIKLLYNSHISNSLVPFNQVFGAQAHGMANAATYGLDLKCYLPDATDLDSAYLLIYHVRCLYYHHYLDAAQAVSGYKNYTFTCTAGSANLTAIVDVATGLAASPGVAYLMIDPNDDNAATVALTKLAGEGSHQCKAFVTVAGSGTATLDRTMTYSASGKTMQMSYSIYHASTAASVFSNSTVSVEQATDALTNAPTSIGADTAGWLTLASELFYAVAAHMTYAPVHAPGYSIAATVVKSYLLYTTNPFYIPSVSSVSYAFFYSDSYVVGQNGITYLTRSNPVLSSVTSVVVSYPVNYTIPAANTVYSSVVNTTTRSNVLTNLPVLRNSLNTNYDTTNVKLNIYRTINGGQTYFLIAQVANGTTTYTDSTSDSITGADGSVALINAQTMYTSGGVVGSDQPPVSKFIHIFSSSVYYAGITDSGQYFPTQIRQSVQSAPEWAPATFADNLDDDITGISSTKSNVIAFCKNSTYRMSGGFSQTGQGALTHDRIADVVGSLNALGIVKTEIGVFFPGNDGFYYTDGYQVIKISLEIDKTYLSLTQSDQQKRAIQGCYDKATRRVWWNMQASPNDSENSVSYVFYLDYGVKPSGVFTTASNGTNYKPSAMVFSQGIQYVGHGSGYILKADENVKYDSTIASTAASAWVGLYIPYNWTSVAINMGTIAKRKYLTTLNLSGKNVGNTLMQPSILKDLNESGVGSLALSVVNYQTNPIWGDARCVWGDSTQVWKLDGKLDVFRRFPRKSLRSDYMQLALTPAYGVIYSSSSNYPTGSTVSVNSTLKTATIATPSGYTSILWYPDIVNAYIYFDSDNYVTGYQITALDATKKIVTYSDASNTSTTQAAAQWQIKGYRLNQRPNLTAIAIGFSQNGSKTQVYPGDTSSSGPGNGGSN